MNYNQLAREIHNDNVQAGWWDNPDRCIDECLMLVVTELAEAVEGERKNLMDDHLPHRKMAEVELADTMIRVLDLVGKLEITIEEDFAHFEMLAAQSIGKKYLHIVSEVVFLSNEIGFQNKECIANAFTEVVALIVNLSEHLGYDLEGAIEEKRAYNKNRLDHKRENRAKENGKKF